MSANDYISITPNVGASTSNYMFIIYVDGECLGFCKTESQAMFIIDDMSDSLVKELQRPNTKVYKETLEDGKVIKVFRQTTGIFVDGKVNLKYHLTYRQVPKYYKVGIPTPPPLPKIVIKEEPLPPKEEEPLPPKEEETRKT